MAIVAKHIYFIKMDTTERPLLHSPGTTEVVPLRPSATLTIIIKVKPQKYYKNQLFIKSLSSLLCEIYDNIYIHFSFLFRK